MEPHKNEHGKGQGYMELVQGDIPLQAKGNHVLKEMVRQTDSRYRYEEKGNYEQKIDRYAYKSHGAPSPREKSGKPSTIQEQMEKNRQREQHPQHLMQKLGKSMEIHHSEEKNKQNNIQKNPFHAFAPYRLAPIL